VITLVVGAAARAMAHVLAFQLLLLRLSAKPLHRQFAYDVRLQVRYPQTLLTLSKTLKGWPMKLRMEPRCVTAKSVGGQLGMIDWLSDGFQVSIWFEYL
jgi:hypothetical protein